MQPVIYADLRCLQDPAYQFRGIGYHTAALLRARKRSELSAWKTIGLTDPRLPALPPAFRFLVDEVTSSANPCSNSAPAIFIDGSPMTHDTRFSLRFQTSPAFVRAAVLYDFIPLDWPGYLPTVAKRIEYVSRVARIRHFDLFFPISEYTAGRLSELAGVPLSQVKVTGACVRRSLYECRDRSSEVPSPYDLPEPYFVTLGGDDKRKNTEVAVKAVRHLNLVYGRRIPLKVIGHYGNAYKSELLHLAGHAEGAGFLEFHPNIPDEELVSQHAGALSAIAPSHIEGFSLPVAEASVCGCPVIASTCGAHMELIDQPEALFQPSNASALAQRLEALLHDSELRSSLVASQAHLGPKFHEDSVGERFWKTIEIAVESRNVGAVITRPRKPRLAFLSPYPPDQSDAAFYTAMTIGSGEKLFDSDLYTDVARPLAVEGRLHDAGAVSVAPLLQGEYNGVLSVLGNFSNCDRILDVFERYGGPCILHDFRFPHIYFQRSGQQETLRTAANLLGRSVSIEEINVWSQNRTPPPLFLEPIIERASPLIVHTRTQQDLLKKRYGAEAHVTTCCPTIFFDDDELTPFAKHAARDRQRLLPNTFVVSSLGSVDRAKGMDTCILAIELLRSWHIPAELYFVGSAGIHKNEIAHISALYGIAEHVHSVTGFVDEATYRDFLVASDAAVQLRTYGFGQLSTALTDCISAGLPCVTTSDLAQSCEAPEYVSSVPDRFSPLLVAEKLALIWEAQTGWLSCRSARATYLETHNFEYYGKRLIEILGVA